LSHAHRLSGSRLKLSLADRCSRRRKDLTPAGVSYSGR
jgi:hypothetical protein